MSIMQIDPPLPLECPKGKGMAHFMIDYGVEYNLMWVIIIDATGEIWTYENPSVKGQKNITIGRNYVPNCS
jgi:hypothetical protein